LISVSSKDLQLSEEPFLALWCTHKGAIVHLTGKRGLCGCRSGDIWVDLRDLVVPIGVPSAVVAPVTQCFQCFALTLRGARRLSGIVPDRIKSSGTLDVDGGTFSGVMVRFTSVMSCGLVLSFMTSLGSLGIDCVEPLSWLLEPHDNVIGFNVAPD
jgi:hypothetical protein